MEIPILKDILTIFGLSIVVLYICHRLNIPAIVGYLVTGIVAGPHGFGLVNAVHEVELLAEIGIVLLLFSIGIEFSFDKMLQSGRAILIGGSLQVLLTSGVVFIIARSLGQSFGESVFAGFLISLSSTAIILKLLQERAEVDSPHGRAALGILIFQDIAIVPMMLITPLLAGGEGNVGISLLILLAKALVIITLVIIGAKFIVPHLLYQIARTRNHELFLLSIVAICLAVAWLTSSAGLSLALGAFLAGLIISESEYSHQALGNILPFKDVYTSFFFVSIGMLMNTSILLKNPVLIILATLAVLGIKSIVAFLAAAFLGFPVRTTILVGLALSQVGEFSFILSRVGVEHGLLAGDVYQAFLAISVLTMVAAPFILKTAPRMADLVSGLPLLDKITLGRHSVYEETVAGVKDHLIIIGYGLNGKNVARAASVAHIPYLILEMNAETVRKEKENDEPIYYGDASQEAVLRHVNIEEARVIVIAISDPAATLRILEISRRLNPKVFIIVRTRYIQDIKTLYELGADEVIPEEFETSIEIFAVVLKKYLVPRDEIEKFISEVRSDGYEMLRSLSREEASFSDLELHLPDLDLCTFRVGDGSPAAGKTLSQVRLRKEYGLTMLAIRRGSEILYNPHGDTRIQPNDLVVIVGRRERTNCAANLFISPQPANEEPGK